MAAYLKHLEMPVRSILDVGCGTGNLLRALEREYPRASATGVEYSDYLCDRYGWQSGSVIDYRPARPVDLVICQDVLGYLDDAACARALGNLAEITRRVLFLGVLTTEDLNLCDPERTDADQIDRPRRWYQRRLEPTFVNVGGGIWLKQPLEVTVWSLDRL